MIVGFKAGEQGMTFFSIEPKPVVVAGGKNR